jgi:hypothetical protein
MRAFTWWFGNVMLAEQAGGFKIPREFVGARGGRFVRSKGRVRPVLVGAILNMSVSVAWNCCALEKLGPGEPSAFSMPSERRLSTDSPDLGCHVAYR